MKYFGRGYPNLDKTFHPLSFPAASRILSRPCNATSCLCVQFTDSLYRPSPWSPAFPPQPPPRHGLHAALFGSFFGTMPVSDCSGACMQGLRPQAFPRRSVPTSTPDASQLSRFSNIECPRMHRVSDSAGPDTDWLYSVFARVAFPIVRRGRRPGRVISELNGWPALPLSTLHVQPRDRPHMTRGHDGSAPPFM